MTACRNCPHYDYAHEDVRLGELCLVEFEDSVEPDTGSLERCPCPGFEPDVGAEW